MRVAVDFIGNPGGLTKATKTAEKDLASLGKHASAAGKDLAGMAGSVTGIGKLGPALTAGGIFTALGKMANDSVDAAIGVGKLSRATGESAQDMSGFAYAARMTGMDVDELGKNLNLAAKNMESGKWEKLGIDAQNADGSLKPFGATIGEVADKFQQMGDGPERQALALQLFGRGGASMVAMLKDGKEGLGQFTEEAKRFGLVFDDAAIKKAREAKKAQRELGAAWEGLATSIGQMVTPALTRVSKDTTEVLEGLRRLATGGEQAASSIGETALAKIKSLPWAEQEAQIAKVHEQLVSVRKDRDETSEWSPWGAVDKHAYATLAVQLNKSEEDAKSYRAAVEAYGKEHQLSGDAAQKAYDLAAKGARAASGGAEEAEEATKKLEDGWIDLAGAISDAQSAQDKYFGKGTDALTLSGEFTQAQRDMAAAIKENGTLLDWNTGKVDMTSEAGMKNLATYIAMKEKITETSLALQAANPYTDAGTRSFASMSEMMRNQLLPMFGGNKDAVDKLMGSLQLTAKDWQISMHESGMDQILTKSQTLLQTIKDSMVAAGLDVNRGYGGMAAAIEDRKKAGTYPRNAAGTQSWRGGGTSLSEYGPEVAVLPQGTRIFGARDNVGGGGGGQVIEVHAHTYIDGAEISHTVHRELPGLDRALR